MLLWSAVLVGCGCIGIPFGALLIRGGRRHQMQGQVVLGTIVLILALVALPVGGQMLAQRLKAHSEVRQLTVDSSSQAQVSGRMVRTVTTILSREYPGVEFRIDGSEVYPTGSRVTFRLYLDEGGSVLDYKRQ